MNPAGPPGRTDGPAGPPGTDGRTHKKSCEKNMLVRKNAKNHRKTAKTFFLMHLILVNLLLVNFFGLGVIARTPVVGF